MIQIAITYLISSLIMALFAYHFLWMSYASNERPDEYYRHPFFEPGWGDWQDYATLPIFISLFSIFGLFFSGLIILCIVSRVDLLDIYVERDLNRSKAFWKFWRWGIKAFPIKSTLKRDSE